MYDKMEDTYETLKLRLCQYYIFWLDPYKHLADGYDG